MYNEKAPVVKSPFTLSQRIGYFAVYCLSLIFGRGIRVSTTPPKGAALEKATRLECNISLNPLDCGDRVDRMETFYLYPSWLGMCGAFRTHTADAVLKALQQQYDPGLSVRIDSFRHGDHLYRYQAQPAIQLRRRPDDVNVKPGHVWILETV